MTGKQQAKEWLAKVDDLCIEARDLVGETDVDKLAATLAHDAVEDLGALSPTAICRGLGDRVTRKITDAFAAEVELYCQARQMIATSLEQPA